MGTIDCFLQRCCNENDCQETCTCASAYTVGLETFVYTELSYVLNWLTLGLVMFVFLLGVAGAIVSITNIEVPMGNVSDTFYLGAWGLFSLQILCFYLDLWMFVVICDHYNQASFDNPQRDIIKRYLILSGIFIIVRLSQILD